MISILIAAFFVVALWSMWVHVEAYQRFKESEGAIYGRVWIMYWRYWKGEVRDPDVRRTLKCYFQLLALGLIILVLIWVLDIF